MDLRLLHAALVLSWENGTRPCQGQSAETALVVQDRFGGHILKCWSGEGEPRYWNELPDGRQVDLCVQGNELVRESTAKVGRDIVLAAYGVETAYRILDRKVERWLEVLESASRERR